MIIGDLSVNLGPVSYTLFSVSGFRKGIMSHADHLSHKK